MSQRPSRPDPVPDHDPAAKRPPGASGSSAEESAEGDLRGELHPEAAAEMEEFGLLDPDEDPEQDQDSSLDKSRASSEPAGKTGPKLPQPPEPAGVDRDMASAAWQTTAAQRPAEAVRTATPLSTRRFGSSAEQTDAEVMLRVRDGDEAAFTYLIEKYQRPIVHFMFRMVHNQAVAEELTQEVFLRVYRSRASYRAEAKFTTWLYRIATNLGVNHARDHKHERARAKISTWISRMQRPVQTPDVVDSRSTAEHEMLREERLKAIRQVVMALPERQRTAVLMHKFQEMDYKQIGEVLRLSESATKSLLFRAYQTAAREFEGRTSEGR